MILEALFNGEIYASENVVPKSDKVREATGEIARIMSFFEDKLSKEDYALLEKLCDSHADEGNMTNEVQFKYDLTTIENRKLFQYEWDAYFARISPCANQFATSAASLVVDVQEPEKPTATPAHATNLTEFGDEGEQIVYEYEKKRVASFNQRLANKVLSLGKTRGLGYDIQSVIAEPGDMAEFVKYIEVKSTKRLTCPDINDDLWIDTLTYSK